MTIVGGILVVLGALALVAGLTALAAERLGGAGFDRYRPQLRRGAVLAGVAAVLMLAGFVLGDVRRIADVLGVILLAATLLALIVAAIVPIVRRSSRVRWSIRDIVSAVLAALLLVLVAVGAVMFRDFLSFWIFVGFAFVLLGALALIAGLGGGVVTLILRRGRARSAVFLWSSFSIVVIGLVGIGILAPRPPSVPEAMGSSTDLDAYLEDLVQSDSPPSIAVVVLKDGETVYSKAFGMADGPNGISATPDSVYHWYSTTKIVTAIATMQLVDQGLITLDDPVSDHLSFFDPGYPSASSPAVTIADLLNHSSGLQQNVPAVIGWLHLEDEPALDQTEFLRDKLPSYDGLKFEPGTEGVYTNVGYYTLAGVIEQVTGQSYEQYVVEHVLDPLGMTNTRFEYTEAMRANEAVGAQPPGRSSDGVPDVRRPALAVRLQPGVRRRVVLVRAVPLRRQRSLWPDRTGAREGAAGSRRS